jgi:hypothetical protein
VPAPAAAAGLPVDHDHDVAELGAHTGRAAKRPAVEDHAAADSRPEGEHHDEARTLRGARVPLADRRGVRVVVDRNRQPVALVHPVTEVDALQRDVHGRHRPARALVDSRGDAEAERGDLATLT